jgi:hypothetical protein
LGSHLLGLQQHGNTLTVALETNGEDCRGAAVAGAHEVAKSCSLKSRSRIRGLWLRVAGLDSDALGSEEEERRIAVGRRLATYGRLFMS